jgi:hypothetical protein
MNVLPNGAGRHHPGFNARMDKFYRFLSGGESSGRSLHSQVEAKIQPTWCYSTERVALLLFEVGVTHRTDEERHLLGLLVAAYVVRH